MPQTLTDASASKLRPDAVSASQTKLAAELAVLAKWEADGLSKGYLWGPNTGRTSKTVIGKPTDP